MRELVSDDADALIKEARRRTRRRRGRIAVAVLLAGVAASYLVTSGGGGGSAHPHPSAGGRPASAAGQQTSPKLALAASLANALQTLFFLNPRMGYGFFEEQGAVTCVDLVAKTTDGGAHFTSVVRVAAGSCATFAPARALTFDDDGDGFLYGPKLYVTHDGGRTWTADAQPGTVVAVAAIGRSVWMAEGGCTPTATLGAAQLQPCPVRLLESSDGGRTWAPAPRQPADTTTTRGELTPAPASGNTWLVRVSASAGYMLTGPDPGPIKARGPASLFYTDDSGASWTAKRIPCYVGSFSLVLSAAPDGALVAVCGGQPSAGSQLKSAAFSTNGGQTWTLRAGCTNLNLRRCNANPLTYGYLGEIDAVSATTAYVIGPRAPLVVTHDGGVSWQAQKQIGEDAGGTEAQVIFLDPDHAFVLGRANTATAPIVIWRTANGGRSWTAVTPNVS